MEAGGSNGSLRRRRRRRSRKTVVRGGLKAVCVVVDIVVVVRMERISLGEKRERNFCGACEWGSPGHHDAHRAVHR